MNSFSYGPVDDGGDALLPEPRGGWEHEHAVPDRLGVEMLQRHVTRLGEEDGVGAAVIGLFVQQDLQLGIDFNAFMYTQRLHIFAFCPWWHMQLYTSTIIFRILDN